MFFLVSFTIVITGKKKKMGVCEWESLKGTFAWRNAGTDHIPGEKKVKNVSWVRVGLGGPDATKATQRTRHG